MYIFTKEQIDLIMLKIKESISINVEHGTSSIESKDKFIEFVERIQIYSGIQLSSEQINMIGIWYPAIARELVNYSDSVAYNQICTMVKMNLEGIING